MRSKKPTESNAITSYISKKELALRWGVSDRYIDELISARKIAFTKFGKLVRISLNVVTTFEADNSVPAFSGSLKKGA